MRRAGPLLVLFAVTGCGSVPLLSLPRHDAETDALIASLADERRVPSRRPGSQYVLVCPGINRLVKRGNDAAPALERALDHENPVVRRNAAIALARLKQPSARRVLLRLLTEERLTVLESIAVIDAFDSVPGVAEDETVQQVLARTARHNAALDCAVATEFGQVGNPAASRFLGEVLVGRPADPDARAAAADALGRLGLKDAPEALLKASADGSARVRAAAAASLGAIGDPDAAAVVNALMEDDALDVQRAAITAAGRVGGPEAVGRLLVFLDYRLPSVREEAVTSLAALKSVVGLEHALLNDQWRVREAAVKGLGAIGTEPALRALRRTIDDRSLTVRRATVAALAADRQFAAVPLLLMALEDEAPVIREAAHRALCAVAGKAQPYDYQADEARRRQGIEAWERWWLTVNPATVRTPADVAKREREVAEQIAKAINDLASGDAEVRGRAEHRLKRFGLRAVPALETTFDHSLGRFPPAVGERILPEISEVYAHVHEVEVGNQRTRRQAALELSRLDKADRVSRTAAAALVPLAEKETDAFTRRFLLDVVAKHSGAGATRVIVEGLSAGDAWERTKSARLLGKRRARSAVPVLIGTLRDRNAMVRKAAVWALARIGDSRAIDPLKPMLTTSNVELRMEVAAALAAFREQDGIDDLLRNLANPDWRLRKLAAEKCGEARLWDALPGLAPLLTDGRSQVRDAAVAALRAITNQNFDYHPAARPADRDRAVRQWQAYIRDHAAGQPR